MCSETEMREGGEKKNFFWRDLFNYTGVHERAAPMK